MKWFKHYSDSHTNLKLRDVLAEHGMEGYGFWWVCVELIAQQGTNFRIKSDKNWKKTLSFDTRIEIKKIDALLNYFSETNLIDKKALENGDLFIPKLKDYGDEYTDKVRRLSRQGTDTIVLDKTRTEEIRLEQNKIFQEWWDLYPSSARNVKKAQAEIKLLLTALTVAEAKKRLEKLRLQKSSDRKWIGGYIPNMSTYLNQERWNMDVEKGITNKNLEL